MNRRDFLRLSVVLASGAILPLRAADDPAPIAPPIAPSYDPLLVPVEPLRINIMGRGGLVLRTFLVPSELWAIDGGSARLRGGLSFESDSEATVTGFEILRNNGEPIATGALNRGPTTILNGDTLKLHDIKLTIE